MTAGAHRPVVIVGGGPVGVGLAIELGLRGVACAVVERHESIQQIPKGQNLTQRTMEHFRAWGIEDELRAARTMPDDFPIGGVTAYRDLASPWWFRWMARERVRAYYHTDNERLPQFATEAVLRARAATVPGVELHLGWTATSVEQDGERATVVAERTGGAGRLELTADHVVGCDGARSLVRRAAGIDQALADHDRRMVLLLFRSRALHDRLERMPGTSFYKVLHPGLDGYWAFFGRVDLGQRWFFHCPVPADTTAESGDWAGLLARYAGGPIAAEIDHVGFWDLRFASARAYRRGRLLIAGDACHNHPPYGGYGLNVGLEDARNLGWKLAAHHRGWGGDRLLDSYDLERRPVFETLSEHFIEASIIADRRFVTDHHPDRDLVDFEAAWAAEATGGTDLVGAYEPHYEGSPVVFGPAGGVCSARGDHRFTARAGHHLAPRAGSDGGTVADALGPDFTLLGFDAAAADLEAVDRAAADAGVPLEVVADDGRGERADYGARLVLVRPDHYVAWAADGLDHDPATIIASATGRHGTA